MLNALFALQLAAPFEFAFAFDVYSFVSNLKSAAKHFQFTRQKKNVCCTRARKPNIRGHSRARCSRPPSAFRCASCRHAELCAAAGALRRCRACKCADFARDKAEETRFCANKLARRFARSRAPLARPPARPPARPSARPPARPPARPLTSAFRQCVGSIRRKLRASSSVS